MTNWETVKVDDLYEISSDYPYPIRKKNGKTISEHIEKGKATLSLRGKKYRKDKIIALQFIPNPNDLPYIWCKTIFW